MPPRSSIHPKPVRAGVVGCGTIAPAYLRGCRAFDILDVVAVADLDRARAVALAAEFGVERVLEVGELFGDPSLELVVDLTNPGAHAAVNRQAIRSGKHLYSEKPLALTREDGAALVEEARRVGVRLGVAPDTFLGAGLQTCRALIDEGALGRPISATAYFASNGPESWHPDPEFLYLPGAGPLFDMGPYYLTALATLLGPIAEVAGMSTVGRQRRTIRSGPRAGRTFASATPTHVNGLLRFASGAVGTLTTSFDLVASEHPKLEIHGTEGTLALSDPNTFGGPVRLRGLDDDEWIERPLRFARVDELRGLGAADLAYAVREDRAPRASGTLALHVLDVMQTLLESAEQRRTLPVRHSAERPDPLEAEFASGALQVDTHGAAPDA